MRTANPIVQGIHRSLPRYNAVLQSALCYLTLRRMIAPAHIGAMASLIQARQLADHAEDWRAVRYTIWGVWESGRSRGGVVRSARASIHLFIGWHAAPALVAGEGERVQELAFAPILRFAAFARQTDVA